MLKKTKQTGFLFPVGNECHVSSARPKRVAVALRATMLPLAIGLSGTGALAQDQAPGAETGQGQLADIVVTAEKRSTSLQKTPIAVTALSGEALQQAQVRTLQDLNALAPSFKMSETAGYPQITVRGIGINNFQPLAESAVAVNLNEAYISRPVAFLSGLYDVSAIEVLRGPQGTLYGRNATAGAVNITTNRPDPDRISGDVRATVANYGQLRLEGAVGGPLVEDQLMVRIAGFREKRNGYGTNLITGNDVDDKDAYGVRGTLVISPMDSDIKATIIGEYNKEHENGAGYHHFGAAGLTGIPGTSGTAPTFIQLGGIPASDPRDLASELDPKFRLRTTAVTGILEWASGPFGLKSITGYRDQNSFNRTELSGGAPGTYFMSGEPAHQFSQELQANYNGESINLTAGLFYFKEHDDYAPAALATPYSIISLLFGAPPEIARLVPGYNHTFDLGGLLKTTAKAAFAQGTVNLTDELSVTAGIRFSSERKQLFNRFAVDFSRPYTGNFDENDTPPPAVEIPAKTFKATTPKLGIQYQLTSRTLVYASYAKGFKSGGFFPAIDPAVIALGVLPEKLTAYEGGIKTTLFDNRLRFNLSGFHYDYSDLQVSQIIGVSLVTTNAASARVYGAEAEFSAALTPALTIEGNASWMHARYRNYTGPDNALPLIPSADFSGKRLNNAPDFQAYLAASYRWDLPGANLLLRGEGDYTSKVFFSPPNIPLVGQSAFAKANASLTYTSDAGWRATAFIRNITDKTTRASVLVTGQIYGYGANGSLAPPRTYGLELGYRF